MGFEPTTPGLKVRSSTTELRAPVLPIVSGGESLHNRLDALHAS